jgi:hypothetical protein
VSGWRDSESCQSEAAFGGPAEARAARPMSGGVSESDWRDSGAAAGSEVRNAVGRRRPQSRGNGGAGGPGRIAQTCGPGSQSESSPLQYRLRQGLALTA